MKFLAVLLLLSTAAFATAQNPDVAKYASRQILLVSPTLGTEGILPVLVPTDGQQRLEFIPTSQIKEVMAKGAQPIRLGDIISLLGASTETINKLQAENKKLQDENDRLWKIAMKDAPRPQTIVIQPPTQTGPSPADIAAQQQAEANARRQQALQVLMMMQSNRPQPYQLPMPVNPNAGRMRTNCTSSRLGNSTYTNCN